MNLLESILQNQITFTEKGWWPFFESIIKTPAFEKLQLKLINDTKDDVNIYPNIDNIFKCLLLTGLNDIKVIIFGQDPYHQPNAADGLAFSHTNYPYIQPSLANIFKELQQCGFRTNGGNLESWARQGVLLLNSALTVQEGLPESHLYYWRPMIIELCKYIAAHRKNIIILMWGVRRHNFI